MSMEYTIYNYWWRLLSRLQCLFSTFSNISELLSL